MMAFLLAAYDEDVVEGETRSGAAPRPAARAVPGRPCCRCRRSPSSSRLAREVAAGLRPTLRVDYDVTQSIGRRYRRQDEIGTPYCVTVDFDSIDDRAVTVRDRDTTAQERVAIGSLAAHLAGRLAR